MILIVKKLFVKFYDIVLSPLEICESTLVSSDSEIWEIDVMLSFYSIRDFLKFLEKFR